MNTEERIKRGCLLIVFGLVALALFLLGVETIQFFQEISRKENLHFQSFNLEKPVTPTPTSFLPASGAELGPRHLPIVLKKE